MLGPVVRVSIGSVDTDKAAVVEAKLIESKAELEAGIRAMHGNLGYYVGIDRVNNAMSNVSIWESVDAANQMATFQPMLDLAGKFVALASVSNGQFSILSLCGNSPENNSELHVETSLSRLFGRIRAAFRSCRDDDGYACSREN